MLRRLFNWLLGRPNIEPKKSVSNLANEFQAKKTLSWSTVLAILGMTAISTPILYIIANKLNQAFKGDDDEDEEEGIGMLQAVQMNSLCVEEWKPTRAVVLYDFRPQSPDDLELYKGNIIMILSKPFPGWWEGEVIDGRARGARGLFPENYVQVEGEQEGKIEEIFDDSQTQFATSGTLTNSSLSLAASAPTSDTYNRRMNQLRRF